jgi:hypothetical protein
MRLGRALLISVLALGAGAAGAAAQQARTLAPTGGMWQSLPPAAAKRDKPQAAKQAGVERKPRRAAKAAAAKPARKPVAAAAVAKDPPRITAAGNARELSRRIEILAPGMKLGQSIHDPENPRWRRPNAGRAGPDGRDFSVPFDDSGRAGIIARGHHEDPSWHNPHGNLGATFGLRTKF